MKINNNYVLREIAGDYIIVPIGENVKNFNGLIVVNETGKFIWENLNKEVEEDRLISLILEEYEVDEETATKDVREFISILKNNNILDY